MPASYKQTLNEELKKSMANTDPEVHAKSVAVLQKLTGVLRDKKPLIIETVNGLSQGQEEDCLLSLPIIGMISLGYWIY